MRNIINVSITKKEEKRIRENIKKYGFSSIGVFLRYRLFIEELLNKKQIKCSIKDIEYNNLIKIKI